MNSTPQGRTTPDSLDDEVFDDLIGDWAEELRAVVVDDLPQNTVDAVAEMATTAALTGAAAATTAGISAVGSTGGQTLSSLLISSISKFAASAAVVASIGAGGAIAGVLPDVLQTQAADLADIAGLSIPRPDVTVDVDGAGEVVVRVVDGVLEIVELDAEGSWNAEVLSRTDTGAVVVFVEDTATKTVTIVTDTAGDVSSVIEDHTSSDVGINGDATVTGDVDGNVDPAPASSTEVDVEIQGSTGADLDVPGIGITADGAVTVEGGLELGN